MWFPLANKAPATPIYPNFLQQEGLSGLTSPICILIENFPHTYTPVTSATKTHTVQYQRYQHTLCASYTFEHTSHLSFGSAAGSHPNLVQPAASSPLPSHHCTVASTDGLTYTHTQSLKTNSRGVPLTI